MNNKPDGERKQGCRECGEVERHKPTCDFWKKDVTGSDAVLDSERGSAHVYCHGCSEAGGADRAIYHAPPACNSQRGESVAPDVVADYETDPVSREVFTVTRPVAPQREVVRVKQRRRVIVLLEIDGTYEQAQAVQDAIGKAVDDDFLGAIVTRVISEHEIPHVWWEVKGERWESPIFVENETADLATEKP